MTESGGGNQPLLIVCAGGNLPFAVARAAERRGRQVFLYALRGWADPAQVAAYKHAWGGMAQLARFQRFAAKNNCRDVVFIGAMTRPSVWQLRPDMGALRMLPQVLAGFRGGDNHLLSMVARTVERYGFAVIGAHEIAPEILVPEGSLGSVKPTTRDLRDIARGAEVLRALGPLDIGQAVIIADSRVLAIEAADGTDAMLDHVAALRRDGKIRISAGTGVLIKAPKVGQDMRLDLPSIGPRTIEMVSAAGLVGVAVETGGTIVAEPQQVVVAADRRRIFVLGFGAEAFRS
jgi:DUF1009 family protein